LHKDPGRDGMHWLDTSLHSPSGQGVNVGDLVGDAVGEAEGEDVGDVLGLKVGDAVGLSVYVCCASKQTHNKFNVDEQCSLVPGPVISH